MSTLSIVNSIVIILVTDAGAYCSSIFFSYTIFPLIGSISKADLASILVPSLLTESSNVVALTSLEETSNKVHINNSIKETILLKFLNIISPPFKISVTITRNNITLRYNFT